jgi:protein-disulfide isomerase
MASKAQQKRKELREKRLAAESKAKSVDSRQNLYKIIGIAAFVAVVGIGIAIAVSIGGSGGSDGGKSTTEVDKLLAGIPQNNTVLGDPKAPVTLVEFGDLQCPICKQYSDTVTPDVISGPVKDGKAKFEFKQWTILGPDSGTAAKAAYAAGLQNKYWQYIENWYANQGTENTGYVTDGFMKDIAEKSGVPDMDKWDSDRTLPKWDKIIAATDTQAGALGFTGTPSFGIQKGNGKISPIANSQTSADLIKAINDAQ